MNQLKECVSLLREEDGFDSLSDHGYSFGSGKDLYNVFVKPFADVVSTGAAEVSKASVKAQTLAKTAFEAVATTVVPFLSSDYEKIWDEEARLLDDIKERYKEVYDATWTAFKDNDVMSAAFGYAPAAFLTHAALKKAPLPVLRTLNALTGGRLNGVVNKVAAALKGRDTKKPIDRDSGGQVIDWRRRAGDSVNEVKVTQLKALLDDPKVKQAVESNEKVSRLQRATRKVVRDALESTYDRARAVARMRNIDDVQRVVGKKIPGLDRLRQMQGKEREAVVGRVLAAIKQGSIKVYETGITSRVKKAIAAGVPKDHPYVVDHVKALQKIRSL